MGLSGAYYSLYRAEMLSNSTSLPWGLYFSRIRIHILNLLHLYAGLCRKMARTLSGSIPDMRRRRRRELWCSVPRSVFVKSLIPANEALSNQARMRAWNMRNELRYPFQALRKKLSEAEGCCPPAG